MIALGLGVQLKSTSLHLRTMSLSIIHYTACPVCEGRNVREVMVCKDFTVSQEKFSIMECGTCSTRFTQHVPAQESIGPYYQSDTYISHSDTSKGLISKLYKLARRYTLQNKVKNVKRVSGLDKGTLLDIGCGTGAFLHAVQTAGWQVTGLEPDSGARSLAYQLHGLQVKDNEHLNSLPAGEYDVITLWHVLEHIHDLHGYLEQIVRLLKPKGTVIIAVPNYTSKDATHYNDHWAAYDVPRHLYHFTPKSMAHLAGIHQLKVVAIQPMWLDAFYIALLSEQYQHGNQRLIPAFVQGLKSVTHAYTHPGNCSSQVYVLKQS
jgi:2-polyprenyl-3-methyl-5-hydroxy-6-metoxy-1,4-benzoquinol methylase